MQVCPNCQRENTDEASFCQFCGTALSSIAKPGQQRKTVTVLFSDVADSTALGESLDPEALREVMDLYFKTARAVVERHGGTVEKFIGDAVMAVFGIPNVHEDDALRAVRAASEIQDRLDRLNDKFQSERGVTISTRVGINTGEVFATGDSDANERLVTGDTVNVAARLEQAAGAGEILVGDATRDLVRDAVLVEPLGDLELKGKSEPISAFRLIKVDEDAPGRKRRMETPMVGRDRQLRTLSDAWEQTIASRTSFLFTVLGAPGVGKSRLVREFSSQVGESASIHIGRCLSYGEGITFWPLEQIVRSAVSSPEHTNELEPYISQALAGSKDQQPISDRLSAMLQPELDSVPLHDGFWAARRFLEHLATQRPIVVVLDDLQWAEPALLDLIEHVADWSKEAPILLLCMARPELLEIRPSWGGGKMNATSILLETLQEADTVKILDNVLAKAELPETVSQSIVEASEGNPLYVEEVVAMLIDDGHLVEHDGEWTIDRELTEIAVPRSIQAIIESRLDSLTVDERSTIERAAMEGYQFHAGTISALSAESDRSSVQQQLGSLFRKELIRTDRSEFPEDEGFRFKHLLIRDVAYESIPKADRADLHKRFAEYLTAKRGAMPVRLDAIIGHHLESSYRYLTELGTEGDSERDLAGRAGGYLASAARTAALQGDYFSSVSLLRRAVDLLQRSGRQSLQERIELIDGLRRTGRYKEADDLVAALKVDSRLAGNRHIELLAGVQDLLLRDHLDSEWADETRIALSEELEHDLTNLGDMSGAVEAIFGRLNGLGRDEALVEIERAKQMAFEAGNSRLHLDALLWLVGAGFMASTPASELVDLARAIIQSEDSDLGHSAMAMGHLGGALQLLGKWDEGRAEVERGIALVTELGLKGARVGAFGSGMVERVAGDIDQAESLVESAIRELDEIGEKNRLSTLAGTMANIKAIKGEVEVSERWISKATDAAAPGDVDTFAEIATARGETAFHHGQFKEASDHFRSASELLATRDMGWWQSVLKLRLAAALAASGDTDQARSTIEEALPALVSKEAEVIVAQAREQLADLHQ